MLLIRNLYLSEEVVICVHSSSSLSCLQTDDAVDASSSFHLWHFYRAHSSRVAVSLWYKYTKTWYLVLNSLTRTWKQHTTCKINANNWRAREDRVAKLHKKSCDRSFYAFHFARCLSFSRAFLPWPSRPFLRACSRRFHSANILISFSLSLLSLSLCMQSRGILHLSLPSAVLCNLVQRSCVRGVLARTTNNSLHEFHVLLALLLAYNAHLCCCSSTACRSAPQQKQKQTRNHTRGVQWHLLNSF